MSTSYKSILADISAKKNIKQADILSRFFKTAKGQYGYGDFFLGIKVPVQRQIAKKYITLKLDDLQKLINSKFHECRLTSLLILTYRFPKSSKIEQREIYNFYIKNLNHINNWDLVDLSAPNIIGNYLYKKSHRPIYNLVKSKNIWHRRIAVLSTFHFIKNNDFTDSIRISKLLLNDKHDLIHKAVGWMLREIGKRDQKQLIEFLDEHCLEMPRTMLRYAIEKLSESERKKFLIKK